jgi:hypothetical protein
MSDTLRVQWTIVSQMAPQPWLNCNRCGGLKRFRSSEKIRVNANGKRLDAWLIYKCTSCDSTWNRRILERRQVQTIDPLFLMSLRANEPSLARRLAFDAQGLRRQAGHVEEFDTAVVLKNVLSEGIMPIRRLEILCTVPEQTGLRVDRLLAAELHLSRSRVQSLEKTGDLTVVNEGSRALRKPVRDGLRLTIDLSSTRDGDKVAMSAKGDL